MTDLTQDEIYAKKQRLLWLTKRRLLVREAKDSLRVFMRLMLPDEEFPDDPYKSEYQDTAHGALLCEIVQDIEAGRRKRVAVSIPPQHGKTWHLSTFGPAWILGRNPRAKIIVGTYNETRADELGEAFRDLLLSDAYRQVFPNVEVSKSSKSKSAITLLVNGRAAGKIHFVSMQGTVTGRTAHYFFVDDPIKDDEEVQSDTYREKLWKRFFSVAYSRGSKKTRMVVVHTRWHADDLIGRLCDPNHVERGKLLKHNEKEWLYLNLSGVIYDPPLAEALGLVLKAQTDPEIVEAFGDRPCCALWEDEKPLDFYVAWKMAEPRTFTALVMGQPSVEDGEYFKAENLVEYDAHELPANLTIYGASDHAVTEEQRNDPNCIGCVGVDENDVIWVLPDLVWERQETDDTVEDLILQFKRHNPQLWWMEDELISKSFGPFLHKRMVEERVFVTIDPVRPSKKKKMRARAIQGRVAMNMVRFPRHAPWWQQAKSEMLQFPYGVHDDFVDWLSHIGMGLMKERRAMPAQPKPSLCVVGSPQWIMQQSNLRARAEKRAASNRGW
ncbi:phage terminase large subunit [Methyloceanibacter caenitepidi]|uniref:Terminase, large subunit, putative n=1 Tax=Methyloceanibacter caenitepidi TaxID=1384459 RepID=A0A0A8K0R4_9HYPH|nr:phage terminase large subunit [Methyloceanibacter caenitepidi]BAQ16097.1 terminase, large subunit, putative [Methyloceanibacter caenitepidi]